MTINSTSRRAYQQPQTEINIFFWRVHYGQLHAPPVLHTTTCPHHSYSTSHQPRHCASGTTPMHTQQLDPSLLSLSLCLSVCVFPCTHTHTHTHTDRERERTKSNPDIERYDTTTPTQVFVSLVPGVEHTLQLSAVLLLLLLLLLLFFVFHIYYHHQQQQHVISMRTQYDLVTDGCPPPPPAGQSVDRIRITLPTTTTTTRFRFPSPRVTQQA